MSSIWPTKKLKEVLESFDNGIWGPEDKRNGIKILRSTNFNNDGTINFNNVALRKVKNVNLKEKKLKKGDILLERSGGGPTQPVGRVVYFDTEDEYYFGNFITRLRVNSNVYSKFLFYVLFYFHQKDITEALQTQTTNIRNLKFNEYLNFEIPLPPLEIQKRIVARIEELFEKIDKAKQLREKALEKTEQIFQSALQKIFKKLEEIYETKEFIKCIEKPPKQIKGIPKRGYQKLGKFPIVDQGEALIGGYTNDESKIYKGKLPVIIFGDHTRIFKYIDFPFAIGADGTKIIIPKEEINPKFFYYSLKSLDIESLGYSRHYKVLKVKKIPLPPLSEQKKIVAYLDDLREKVEKLKQLQQKQLEELEELKKSILDKAFKGELL